MRANSQFPKDLFIFTKEIIDGKLHFTHFLFIIFRRRVYDFCKLCKTPRVQKQPSRAILRKRCSENMQQINKRTPMPKCDCSKVAFPKNTPGWLLLRVVFISKFMLLTFLFKNQNKHDEAAGPRGLFLLNKSFSVDLLD